MSASPLAALHRTLVTIVLLPVMFYRRVISPMKRTPSCRFLPTCSEYALDAVKQRGIVVGVALAIGRILRCNPLFESGFDPVPPRRGERCGHGHGHVHHARTHEPVRAQEH